MVWQLAAALVRLPLLLPGPWAVARALVAAVGEGSFWASVGLTLLRIALGFSLGALAGTVFAVGTQFVRPLDTLLSPAIRVVRATPVASFIILCMLWIRSGALPAFIAGLMVLPVVWGNVAEGIGQTDKALLEMAKVYRFGRAKTARYIYGPAVAPYFRSACITALGMAWKSGVAAEVLCQPRRAIGTGLYYAKVYLETDRLFAWTAVVIVLSVFMEKGFVAGLKRGRGLWQN